MKRSAVLALTLGLAACANQPCDPHRDRNIFTVGGCLVGGGYQARVDQLQVDLAQVEQERNAAEQDARAAMARRDQAAAAQARLRVDIADERARVLMLQQSIASARSRAGADQKRLAQLQQDLGQLRGEQERLQAEAATRPDAPPRLREEQQQQQQRVRALEQAVLRAAPRD
ncbi:conserved protein of unknown function [Rhodovastum atsumiense]|uniref:Lipoprotein n=1 Tax=Rhodovastum atsumiense TaxID=504468 RepID=A0A5M6IXR5_9PROT|nr:hypothetical protein [Rhodovastum atsumiense]KAA5612188.1 hypothetical protein F1189_11030 [Rhodovastum atsumiense]CAH2603857.1 conserved protein of unknown function [Rhodovastum atsumiense]